jgi:caa(3)-type oxidase subunit IV
MAQPASEPGHAPAPAGAVLHVEPREVLAVFLGLLVLLAVEVALVKTPGIAVAAVRLALLSVAVAKAILIGFFFMHLKQETRVLRLTVLGPLAFPPLYALVLMADAAWRLLR